MCKSLTLGINFLLIVFLIGGIGGNAHAQAKGAWVEYKLPGERPANWARMVGENCLIFLDRDEPDIYAFDVNSGVWHTYTAETDLTWSTTTPDMGRNVGLVYNDEMVVAYSGLTQTFVPLTYSDTLLNNHPYGHACEADMAWFVTDQFFYVFDGEDAVWRSFDISDVGVVESYGVYGIEDYIFLNLNLEDDYKKIVAFSYITKTFLDYDGYGFIEYKELQGGFVFYKNMTPQSDSLNHFFAAFTASSGSYNLMVRPNSDEVWNDMVTRGLPATTFMFHDRNKIEDDHWQIDIYGFDTRHGDFVKTSFDYSYVCNDNCPYISGAGSEIAITGERNNETGVIRNFIYNGRTNTYSTVITPLIYPTCSKDAGPEAGGIFYSASDCNTVWFYDVEDGIGITSPLPDPVESVTNGVVHRMYEDWGIVDCQRFGDNTVYVYSYNRNNHNLQTFQVESSLSHTQYDSTNIGGLLIRNTGGPYQMLMYAPGTDTWVTVDFGSSETGYGRGIQRDLIYWYNYAASGPLNIFDGVTGQETVLPFGWAYSSTAANHLYSRSNFVVSYGNDDKYYGYSTYTRTYSEYAGEFMSGFKGQEDLVVMQKTISGGGADVLAYNVLYDDFVMTSFDSDYGTYFDIWVGGKTALIMTLPGYLLAWDPYADATTDIADNIEDDILPGRISLKQNVPNPFNPSTAIQYSLPRQSEVEISIYNALGQKVTTIVDGTQPAGPHTVIWSGTDQAGRQVSTGIYFYRIRTDGYAEAKKMLLLK